MSHCMTCGFCVRTVVVSINSHVDSMKQSLLFSNFVGSLFLKDQFFFKIMQLAIIKFEKQQHKN